MKPTPFPIYRFQSQLSRRLLIWSLGSIALGLILTKDRHAGVRAFGQQALVWGAIDGLIALIGLRQIQTLRHDPAAYAVERRNRALGRLRRLLYVNTFLDILYLLGSGWLLQRGRDSAGHGAGILVQGLFLFFFDLIHARQLPRKVIES